MTLVPYFTERMSSVDLAWLRMDSPRNRMMISGVLVLSQSLDLSRLKSLVHERLLCHPRFVSKVVHDCKNVCARWQLDQNFDLDRHIVPTRLGGRADQASLQRLLAKLASQGLSKQHPLWQFHVIDRYVQPDGSIKSALLVRLHHCIADGIALINLMLSLTAADAALDCQKQPPTTNLKRPVSDQKSALTTLMTQIEAIVLPAGQGESFSVITQLVSDIIRIVSMPDDSRTCLKGKPGLHKRVAWNEPLPLVEVKVVARALGCSVNDVLLSCVAGAIGTYLRQRGNNTEGCEIRAMVPVNLRGEVSRDRNEVLGNQFGLVPLELPVGMEHPVQRLYEIRRRMQSLKGSYQALLSYAVLAAMGYMPQALQQQVMEYLASKATAIMSNVPGPQQLLYLAGARIDQILFWVPQSCDIGLGISILSYNQSVQFGLMTAHNLVSEPQQIIRYFEPEFEKLLWLSLLSPWSEHDLDSDTIEQVLCTKPTRKRHRP